MLRDITADPSHIDVIHGPDYIPVLTHELDRARVSVVGALYMIRPARPDDAPAFCQLWHALHAVGARLGNCRLAVNIRFPAVKQAAYNQAAAYRLSLAGWKVRTARPDTVAHSKLWIFDNRRVLLGSSNVAHDVRHPVTNVNLLLDSAPVAARLLSALDPLWAQMAPLLPADRRHPYP